MKYDILFWDIDGTLMDFKRAEAKALSQSLREVDVIPTEELIPNILKLIFPIGSVWRRGN